jgi:hypothetical protein
MHKAVARDILRKAKWSEAQIRMSLRVLTFAGARSPQTVAAAVRGYAEGREDGGERASWLSVAEALEANPQQAEALWSLRGL